MENKHIAIPPPPPPLSPTESSLLAAATATETTPLETPSQENDQLHKRTENMVAITIPTTSEDIEEAPTELPLPSTTTGHKVSNINKKPLPDLTILGFKLPSFNNNPSLRIKVLIAVIISVYLLFYILQVKNK